MTTPIVTTISELMARAMSSPVVITISDADVDGMARDIAKHDGYADEWLPILRVAVEEWFQRIVEDTVTDREFAMRHYGYRWEQAVESAERTAAYKVTP
jgi:hypothetical protein